MIPARGPQTKNLEFLSKAGQSLSWNRKVILWDLSKNSASVVCHTQQHKIAYQFWPHDNARVMLVWSYLCSSV